MRLKCSVFMSAVLLALMCTTGCQSEPDRTQGTASEATPAAAREAPKSGAPVSNSGAAAPAGMTRTVVAYPTGNRESSVVEIVRVAPSQVNLGQNFTSELTVTNLTKLPLGSVTIRDLCAKHFKLASSTPTAKVTEGVLLWDLGALQPGEVRNIKVTGSATELAPVENCVSVLYDQSTCMTINVVQPKLALTATATSEILTCDPIAVTYVVSNPGTGSAMNVVVSSPLPEGVVTDAGLNSLSFKAGDLPPGASKSFDVKLKTTKTGKLETKPVATANDGLTASAVTTTVAHTPVLTLSKTGPEQQYAGRNVTYEMVLTNKGDGDARDTVLEDTLPANTQFISASQGGAVAGNKVVWKLGTLKPDAAVHASVVVLPTSFGVIENAASASAYCAKPVAATVKTNIQGIPAILLEVVDQQDPIAVGENETYVITVTNQGTAADTNIAIVCELEDGMQFVSAGGATTASNDGKTITFKPLGTLAPKAKASWQVVVKATAPGDMRFKTSLTSGELTRPVMETEATRFYK